MSAQAIDAQTEIKALIRQYMVFAKHLAGVDMEQAKTVTGLPEEVLKRLVRCSFIEIETIVEEKSAVFLPRINDMALKRLISLPADMRPAYLSAYVSSNS
jgi:hypothetical protein